MKTTDFRKPLTSAQLKENINKQFGMNVNLNRYSREQLEDMRNKLRTRVSQQEGQTGINDLLTNETYQKDKAMLALLNTRIKEMLGEDIKKLRDKMQELSEAKKSHKKPIKAKGSKGSSGDQDDDGDQDFADVMSARMQASGKSKAAANAAVKNKPYNKEDVEVEEGWPDPKAIAASTTGKFEKKKVGKGTIYSKKASDKDDSDENKGSTDDFPVSTLQKRSGEKLAARTMPAGKGHVVKGKAQSGPQPDDHTGESIAEEGEKWVAKAVAGTKKGALRKQEHKKKGEKFSKGELKGLAAHGTPKEKKRAQFALNISKKNESIDTFRKNVKMVNESLSRMLAEDEEGKAKAITAASDIVNDFTSWMQRVGQYQTKAMVELSDAIRADFGAQQAEQFKSTVAPALETTLGTLMAQREAISNAVAVLAGEETAAEPMGAEPSAEMPAEPGMEPSAPDMMNEPEGGDEFAASDAAAGAGTPGREMRESRFSKKLAESHSIISKLAK